MSDSGTRVIAKTPRGENDPQHVAGALLQPPRIPFGSRQLTSAAASPQLLLPCVTNAWLVDTCHQSMSLHA